MKTTLDMAGRIVIPKALDGGDHTITGGAAYDALVAATAAGYSVELITCDRRAAPTYESYGVRVIFLV